MYIFFTNLICITYSTTIYTLESTEANAEEMEVESA